jgi:hypothetical protein
VGRYDNSVAVYKSLAPLPRTESSPGVYLNDRGTYPNSVNKDVWLPSDTYSTSAGMMRIRAGGGSADPYGADAWAGQSTPAGYDAMLGVASTLRGNYGVVYRITVPISSPDGRRVAVLMNPWGGAVMGAVKTGPSLTGEGMFYAPANGGWLTLTTQATLFGRWNAAVTPTISFSWTPPGSTSLPVEFVLVPYPEPGDTSANGAVDLTDAVMAMRFAAGVAAPSAKQRIAADVMPATIPDGVITPSDVAWILQNCAGVK